MCHKISSIAFALLLMFATGIPVMGEGEGKVRSGTQERNQQLKQDEQRREIACSCCKQCRAATKEVQGKEEKKSSNGCGDCCSRCGNALPDQRKMPSEIMK